MYADQEPRDLLDPITRNHASTYQPNNFESVSTNLPQEASNPSETFKRLRQAQYADELRQQIIQKQQAQKSIQNTQGISNQIIQTSSPPQNKPMNSFMTSLGSLYGDRTEELERKRKQQDTLAQTLLKQIEEKKEAQKLRRQKEELVDQYYSHHLPAYEPSSPVDTPKQTSINPEPVSYSSVAKQATQMLEELKSGRNPGSTNNKFLNPPPPVYQHPRITKIQPFSQTFNNLNDKNLGKSPAPLLSINSQQPQIVIPGAAQTLPRLGFDISTDSPFSRSGVKTPPLGFSLNRRANSTNKNPMSMTAPVISDPKSKKPQRYSSLAPTSIMPDSTAPVSILDEPIWQKPNALNIAATQPYRSTFTEQNKNEVGKDAPPNEFQSNAQHFKSQVDSMLEDHTQGRNENNPPKLDAIAGDFDLDELNKAQARKKQQTEYEELSNIKLQSVSTLIYPDGHLSPISSPR